MTLTRLKCLLLFCAFFFLFQTAFTQTSCPPNLDFESGDFSNWQCFTGWATSDGTSNSFQLDSTPPISGRHEIITAATTPRKDPYGNFPVFCPYGGKYSVKLGNDQTGGEAEGLSYTFTVPSDIDTFTFTYFYAVVFEDPQHAHHEQPRFFVTAYDVASGDVINCASYDYVSNGTIPGFEKSAVNPNILYKNWSPTSLQFAGLGGRSVRLEFKSADCTLGGHFGYAYVDVGSGCSNILASAPYCIETNSLTLNAPYGFKTYIWYNDDFSKVVGNQQSITFTPPPVTSGVFKVDVIPYPGYGCRDTFHAVVTPLPIPDTPVTPPNVFCQFSNAPVLEAMPTPGNDIVWYLGDTTAVGIERAPVISTAVPDTFSYYVSQKALFGCESFRKKITAAVVPTPIAGFTCNNIRQCENGNNFVFTSTTTNRTNCVYNWDFGDGKTKSSAVDSIVMHTYTTSGNFLVKLNVINAGICASEQTLYVTVVPKPMARFSYPQVVCENQTQVSVSDESTVPDGISVINKWWWNFNGAVLQSQNPATFVPTSTAPLTVKLVATTTEGCRSDTALATLAVHPQPGAAFTFSGALCNNEVITFTDRSRLPQGASGEAIVKWDWQFAGISSSVQHPSLVLAPGAYNAQLITETGFGCRSKATDSFFTVHAKPDILLHINDSCVFRNINYSAHDRQNSVQTWLWDFGNGFNRGDGIITKSYTTEGYRPLTLIGQTVHGCRDTLFRPFTIYDNKAFAGRDTLTAIDEPVQLHAHGGPTVTYVWSPAAGLSDPNIENPVAILDRDQLYRLDAVSREGCDSHSDILIKRYKGPALYIPTAFTPNGDGKNDLLTVFPVGIKTFKYMAVYNRQGQLIFKTIDHTKGWDGTYKGAGLGSEVFVAVAEAIDYKGRPMLQKGTVTLIR